jgi:hypothetical protein
MPLARWQFRASVPSLQLDQLPASAPIRSILPEGIGEATLNEMIASCPEDLRHLGYWTEFVVAER